MKLLANNENLLEYSSENAHEGAPADTGAITDLYET